MEHMFPLTTFRLGATQRGEVAMKAISSAIALFAGTMLALPFSGGSALSDPLNLDGTILGGGLWVGPRSAVGTTLNYFDPGNGAVPQTNPPYANGTSQTTFNSSPGNVGVVGVVASTSAISDQIEFGYQDVTAQGTIKLSIDFFKGTDGGEHFLVNIGTPLDIFGRPITPSFFPPSLYF
jgi:hypothetical protein